MDCVLVTDATQRSSLAITRSLGRRGLRVICCGSTPESLAGHSKYCAKYYQFNNDTYSHPDAYIDFLIDIIKAENVAAVFPTTDLSIEILLNNWQRLSSGLNIRFIGPSSESYNSVTNKNNLFKIAQSVDIKIPAYQEFASAAQLNPDQLDITYPVVLKPYKSIIFSNKIYSNTTVKIADNLAELKTLLSQNHYFQSHPFTLQTYIKGNGAGVFAFYHNGNNMGFFAHKRLKEKPPTGGVSVLSESVTIPANLQHLSEALLNKVNWTGMAMVEYKIAEDGTPYLMEINGRPWGSIQLAIDAGFDFPYLAYQSALDQPIKPVGHYQTGNKLRWLLGDLDRLYLIWKSKTALSTKLSETLSFCNFFDSKVKFEVNRLDDMKPFFYELRSYIKQLF